MYRRIQCLRPKRCRPTAEPIDRRHLGGCNLVVLIAPFAGIVSRRYHRGDTLGHELLPLCVVVANTDAGGAGHVALALTVAHAGRDDRAGKVIDDVLRTTVDPETADGGAVAFTRVRRRQQDPRWRSEPLRGLRDRCRPPTPRRCSSPHSAMPEPGTRHSH